MYIHLRYSSIKKFAFTYMAIPVILFCYGYLKLHFAVVAIAAVLFAVYRGIRESNTRFQRNKRVDVSVGQLAVLLIVLLVWTHLGGMNGYFFQSDDWDCRNAIFRDMITHEWPVTYNNGSALSYYIAFWMPAAAVGKLVLLLTQNNYALAWFFGNGALWIWSVLGLFLISLLLIVYLDANTVRKQIMAVLILIFFSGLDFAGLVLKNTFSPFFDPDYLHLEWWISNYQFSSITTCLYWVFNQAIIPWLAVMCFLFEADASNYLFIGSACLTCGPFPFVGLVLCMVSNWIGGLFESLRFKQFGKMLKRTFSAQNMVVLATIIVVLGLYYMSNNAFSDAAASAGNDAVISETVAQTTTLAQKLDEYFSWRLAAFLILEVGIYLVLLWWNNRRNLMFYTVAVLFLVLPYFRIGVSADFCMRATIPCVFILMTMAAESVIEGWDRFRTDNIVKRLSLIGLIGALCVGAVTPAVEIYRGIYHVVTKQTVMLAKDTIQTFDVHEVTYNFSTDCYPEKLFFKHLAPTTRRVLTWYESGFTSVALENEVASRYSESGGTIQYYNDKTYDVEGTLTMTIIPAKQNAKMDTIRVETEDGYSDFAVGSSGTTIGMALRIPADGKTTISLSPMADGKIIEEAFVLENGSFVDDSGQLLTGAGIKNGQVFECNVVVTQ